MIDETGGPAFPLDRDCCNVGMDLRDYFAAKAMQSLFSDSDYRRGHDFDWIAERSYHMARALLEARTK